MPVLDLLPSAWSNPVFPDEARRSQEGVFPSPLPQRGPSVMMETPQSLSYEVSSPLGPTRDLDGSLSQQGSTPTQDWIPSWMSHYALQRRGKVTYHLSRIDVPLTASLRSCLML